ncbi:MAG: FxLYD domain-containing protein [Chloroflexota bacterium]|nr:MAG: hypothetical protein DIU68_05240 [Chloroflexota bacterium]
MGFWGWRPLVIAVFISVWVTGCNIVSDSAPRLSPTPSPQVTLTARRIATATSTPPVRATRQPAAPSATPAPQSSPTPVTYVVQEGDTLGDIAIRLNVDPIALRDANAEIDPRALQPGQTLIIPLTATPSVNPAATSTPPDLALPEPTCYETPVGTTLCLGAVNNTLDAPLEQVSVVIELFDADGNTLASDNANIEQAVIPPGGLAPYRAAFLLNVDEIAASRAYLQRASLAAGLEERFIQLDITDEQLELIGGRYVVSATLTNPGPETAEAVRAVATLTDGQQVAGYRLSQVAASLEPGDSIPIRLEIVTQRNSLDLDYTLYVEARRGASKAPSP